jgi:POT family proton-dependent oligopeptide transporter
VKQTTRIKTRSPDVQRADKHLPRNNRYLGRYPTIFYGMFLYIIGLAILSITSLPTFIEAGLALPGLLTAMVFIGLGGGGIKANVSTLIAEQYTQTKPFIRITKSGQKVIVDPPLTITRIFSIFCK